MHISVFDIFKIGIGPSSSHTVGPMRAAKRFAERLEADGVLGEVARVKVELFGSLGFTGKGHGSDKAIILGLEGDDPATVEVDSVARRVGAVEASHRVVLLGKREVDLDPAEALIFHRREKLPLHANGMRDGAYLSALAAALAENGNFDEAVSHQLKALEDSTLQASDRADYEARLLFYQQGKPFRDQ